MTDLTSTVNTLTSILTNTLSGISGTPSLLSGFNTVAGLLLIAGLSSVQVGTLLSQLPIAAALLKVIGLSGLGPALIFLGNILKVLGSLLSGNVLGAVNSLIATVSSVNGALPTIQFIVSLFGPLGLVLGLLGKLLNNQITDLVLPQLGPIGTELQLLIKLLPTLATVFTLLGSIFQTNSGIGGVVFPLLNSLMPVLEGVLATAVPSSGL